MQVEIKGVCKRLKKNDILKHIDLTIEGIYGLVGPNGAGKTTLMKILASLHSFQKGDVCIDGQSYVKRGYVQQNPLIGYLAQEFMVYPKITVDEVLDHIAVLQGINDKLTRRKMIQEVLQKVNLEYHGQKKMFELSGGMRRRVGIAQLLLRKPKILIFDEPTAGLDIEERIRFRNLLKNLGNEHTVVISSHIVEDIEFLCNKIGVIKEGNVLFEGPPEALKAQANGCVYEYDISFEEMDAFLHEKEVVQITEMHNHLTVRIFSREAEEGKQVSPRLMDGYLAVVRG